MFAFLEGVNILDCLENMKLYLSNIEESYKDTIVGHFGNSCIEDLLLNITQCWRACVVVEYKWNLPILLYYSGMMYKYYSLLGGGGGVNQKQ